MAHRIARVEGGDDDPLRLRLGGLFDGPDSTAKELPAGARPVEDLDQLQAPLLHAQVADLGQLAQAQEGDAPKPRLRQVAAGPRRAAPRLPVELEAELDELTRQARLLGQALGREEVAPVAGVLLRHVQHAALHQPGEQLVGQLDADAELGGRSAPRQLGSGLDLLQYLQLVVALGIGRFHCPSR